MYCNFVSLKVSSAKVDEILHEKEISYNNNNNNNNNKNNNNKNNNDNNNDMGKIIQEWTE